MGNLLDWLRRRDKKPYQAVQRFAKNKKGRDFVVGDLHGMFSTLKDLLNEVAFDPDNDRLFSLGDLIDRGVESDQALDWWGKDWFYAILGNHEDMLQNREEMMLIWHANGGQWWMGIQPERREQYDQQIRELPLVIEVETERGRVGLVHADIQGEDWGTFCQALENRSERARQVALWSRKRIDGLQRGDKPVRISQIEHVYIGHTVVSDCLTYENISFIDTGACYLQSEQAKLSLYQVHPYVQRYQRFTHTTFG